MILCTIFLHINEGYVCTGQIGVVGLSVLKMYIRVPVSYSETVH